MKYPLNEDIVKDLQQKHLDMVEAVTVLKKAHDAFNQMVKEHFPHQGLGRDAMVKHRKADAHFGHPSIDIVTSRVVGAFANPTGKAFLRVQLGTVKGKLGSFYASLSPEDIIQVAITSSTPY